MKSGPHTSGLIVVAACALSILAVGPFPALPAGVSSATTRTEGQTYPTTSWALGLVVPEGASLQGGGIVQWEGVGNVTALVTLPNITMPDRIVYAVLSVMTDNGAVLQAAAGIRPHDSTWFVYSWLITDVESVPLTYRWILNASGPRMAPGTNITLAIFRASGSWNLKVIDMGTRISVGGAYPSVLGASLMVGDQEVFSFESYSRSGATFRSMSNLTLSGLLVDGTKVVGGAYSYSEWDPSHDPLFVVGSSGTSPPAFISFGQARDGSFVWGYDTVWKNTRNPLMAIVETSAVLLLAFLCALGVVLWKTKKSATVLPSAENRMPA